MTSDVNFLQTLVAEHRTELLAEADHARLANVARRWRRARTPAVPPPPPEPPADRAERPRRRVPARTGR